MGLGVLMFRVFEGVGFGSCCLGCPEIPITLDETMYLKISGASRIFRVSQRAYIGNILPTAGAEACVLRYTP